MDLNVDMGEGYGRWQLGDDAGVMPWITSANIACGFHAGDSATMRRTVRLALEHHVAIGAHVGFPDLLGFGRRALAASPEEVRDYVTHQIGSLSAFATAEGGQLSHVKPHGALYALCSSDPEQASALADAVAGFDTTLPVLLSCTSVREVIEVRGITFALEAFPDLDYHPDGTIVIEPIKRARLPELVAKRATRLAIEGRVLALDGSDVAIEPATLCLHGDAPEAADVARSVRQALGDAGVAIAPLGR